MSQRAARRFGWKEPPAEDPSPALPAPDDQQVCDPIQTQPYGRFSGFDIRLAGIGRIEPLRAWRDGKQVPVLANFQWRGSTWIVLPPEGME